MPMLSSHDILNTTGWLLLLPIRPLLAAAELRRLRRQMPNAHRLWIIIQRGIRPETDGEYLDRLRQLARERAIS
jgi:hypothetical protein